MKVTYWGVRGSMPTTGTSTCRYGGNTSCVSVEVEDRVLVLDAGTGLRVLGQHLQGAGKEVYLLFTHLHFDHIQGFPFFGPLYDPAQHLYLLPYPTAAGPWTPLMLLDGVYFPLTPEHLPAQVHTVETPTEAFLKARGFSVDALAMNHPGGAFGYRIHAGDDTFVYIPDNELQPPDEPVASYASIVEFCAGARVLTHDAQYLADDMPGKLGWGHSQVDEVCQLAIDAAVDHLVLFHHDPDRDDDAMARIEARARERLAPHDIACTAAYEGLTMEIGVGAPQPRALRRLNL